MAFIRNDDKKDLSLPSLIDIIFLLLIFSMVTLDVSSFNAEPIHDQDKEEGVELPDLPELENQKPLEINENEIKTLLIQIEYETENESNIGSKKRKKVIVMIPDHENPISIEQAQSKSERDSLFAFFHPDSIIGISDTQFGRTSACKLIVNSIQKYKEQQYLRPDPSNSISIRAVKDTEFRIINFIMNTCAVYGDTIPKVIIHALMRNSTPAVSNTVPGTSNGF